MKRMHIKLGLHIADFTRTNGTPALGPSLPRYVREAEVAGIRRITVMDHFWQIRGVGTAEHEMLESMRRTERPRLNLDPPRYPWWIRDQPIVSRMSTNSSGRDRNGE